MRLIIATSGDLDLEIATEAPPRKRGKPPVAAHEPAAKTDEMPVDEADEPAAETDEPEADEPEADEPEADEPEADTDEADEPAAETDEDDEPEADEPAAETDEADEPEKPDPITVLAKKFHDEWVASRKLDKNVNVYAQDSSDPVPVLQQIMTQHGIAQNFTENDLLVVILDLHNAVISLTAECAQLSARLATFEQENLLIDDEPEDVVDDDIRLSWGIKFRTNLETMCGSEMYEHFAADSLARIPTTTTKRVWICEELLGFCAKRGLPILPVWNSVVLSNGQL